MIRNKKAQITIFIIIGIIMLLIFAFLIILRLSSVDRSIEKETSQIIISDKQIIEFAQSCIVEVSVDAAYYIASQGGYNELPSGHLEVNVQGQEITMAYGYSNHQDVMISIQKMEEQLEDYIKANLGKCTDGFDKFKGYKVDEGMPDVNAVINDNNIVVNAKYPLIITKGGEKTTVSDFNNIVVPIRLKKVHDIAKTLVNNAKQNPNKGPNLGYISRLGDDNILVYYGWSGNSLYYVINDVLSNVEGESGLMAPGVSNRPFIFNIALDYS